MSLKPIQSPSVPIKPHEYPDHQQVETWTVKWTRWIRTIDKLITTEILQIHNPGPTDKFLK